MAMNVRSQEPLEGLEVLDVFKNEESYGPVAGEELELFEYITSQLDDATFEVRQNISEPVQPPAKKRRHRGPNSVRLLAPRVLRRDIRRTYANMFCNVINNGEAEYIKDFFNRFARPTTSLIFDSYAEDQKEQFPPSFLVPGLQNLSAYFTRILIPFPDMVFRLQEAQVITKYGASGSKVEFVINGYGTKIFEFSAAVWMPFIKTLKNGKVLCSPTEVEGVEEASICDYIRAQHFEEQFEPLLAIPPQVPLSAGSLKVNFQSKLCFNLDENNSIIMFEFFMLPPTYSEPEDSSASDSSNGY